MAGGRADVTSVADVDLAAVLRASEETDLAALIQAKESAKRSMLENPTAQNSAAFERASRALEEYRARLVPADASPASFPNALALEKWLRGQGYKIGKSKIYGDVKAGKLRPEPGGAFSLASAKAYAATLKLADGGGEGDRLAKKQERLLDLKVEFQEIENAERRRRHEQALGLLIPRAEVNKLLAAAVGVLKADMKQFFYARAREILFAAGGRPEKESELIELLLSMQAEWFNRFAAECVFTARLGAAPDEAPDEGMEEEDHAGELD